MPPVALTVSAVDHTTGRLTVTAHGRSPGDGPAAVYAALGGVVPTGLAPVTDYYVIVVDANTVKLASSSANALAGTAVSFSTNGSLPLQLLIGIPYRRARTYVASTVSVPGSQVKSDDLNSVEDSLTAMWNLLTAQTQALLSSIQLAVPVVANADVTAAGSASFVIGGTGHYKRPQRITKISLAASNFSTANGSVVFGAWQMTGSTTSAVVSPIQLEEGERLFSVSMWCSTGTGDSLSLNVYRWDASTGTRTSLGTAANIGAGTGLTLLTCTLTTPEVGSAANAYTYYAEVQVQTFSAALGICNGGFYTSDVP